MVHWSSLGPLYCFTLLLGLDPKNSRVRLIHPRYTSSQLSKSRHYSCAVQIVPSATSPRVVAGASSVFLQEWRTVLRV